MDGARRHYWIEDAEVQIAPVSQQSGRHQGPSVAARLPCSSSAIPHRVCRSSLRCAMRRSRCRASRSTSIPIAVTGVRRRRRFARRLPAARPDRFSFIHFTAHATANVESPLDSAVILSGPEGASKLYARDVAAHPLEAELVTVSACRSAGERAYAGEGLIGFSWAFLRAGARRVIAGLWDVDDRSTAELMDRVYAGLRAGESPSRALRKRQTLAGPPGRQLCTPLQLGAVRDVHRDAVARFPALAVVSASRRTSPHVEALHGPAKAGRDVRQGLQRKAAER